MTIQNIVPKSETSLNPCEEVLNFSDKYVQQAIQDLFDTLVSQQAELDKKYSGAGGGVGLASNQIEYPYEPISENDPAPKEGFYPKDFLPPHMYVISIRKERAAREKCEMVLPAVFINASFTASKEDGDLILEEGCLSIVGIKALHVPRFKSGTVKAYDHLGIEREFKTDGFVSRVHQHELDHCAGKEYLNQMNFSDEDLHYMLEWANQDEKSEIILKDRLICNDIENVDANAFSMWVKNELILRGYSLEAPIMKL